MTNSQFASPEELWEMVKTFSQHAEDLKAHLGAEREKNKSLDAENSGWLEIYRKQLSQIAELKAEISRLESRIQGHQGKF